MEHPGAALMGKREGDCPAEGSKVVLQGELIGIDITQERYLVQAGKVPDQVVYADGTSVIGRIGEEGRDDEDLHRRCPIL